MTRLELYELIWKEPMIHVAKRFGISDVALRKTCIKHNIPTPPLGYWAKLAHGKRVSRPSLPPLKHGERDHIHLTIRPPRQLPASVSAVLEAAQHQQATPEMAIVVPKDRPKELHPIASIVAKAIRKTTANDEGFLTWGAKDHASIVVGRDSIERIIVLLDSFVRALAARGYETTANTDLEIRVENEPFKLRIYETKDRKPYQPTSADIKRQAEYDNNSKRYPLSPWKNSLANMGPLSIRPTLHRDY